MEVIKKIGFRVLLLVVILFISNIIYKHTFWKGDIEKYADLLDSLNKVVYGSDVLYFAESSNFSTLFGEPNQKSISGILQDFLPDIRINAVNKGALHAGLFLSLCKNIPEDSPVKTVVVTLNLRSFNANWINSKLETQLMQQNVMLQPYPPLVNRFLLSFKAYDNKREEERNAIIFDTWKKEKLIFPYEAKYSSTWEWDTTLANGYYLTPDGRWDMPRINLATAFVKTYAFQIDTLRNPRIKDFDKIVDYSKKRNWDLIFNLLAENTEKAGELVGDDLVFLMRQNRDLLVQRYSKLGATVVDNLEVVASEDYIDQDWTTEHYVARGRTQVAFNLAQALQDVYPKITLNDSWLLPELYNDFEGTVSWNATGLRSSERAFSGKYSYKIYAGNQYSEAFELQFNSMFSTPPESVKLKWKTYSEENINDARFVIDLQRDGESYSWQGFEITKYWEKNKWIENEIELPLPDNLNLTDIIKIYAWNGSVTPVFIDDIEIRFTNE